MARIEPHQSNPVHRRVQLTERCGKNSLAMEKGMKLVLEGEEECWVEIEPVALAIALQNRVTNALNFSPDTPLWQPR